MIGLKQFAAAGNQKSVHTKGFLPGTGGFPLSAQRDRMREACPCNVDFLLLKLARSTMKYIIAYGIGAHSTHGQEDIPEYIEYETKDSIYFFCYPPPPITKYILREA